MRTGSAGQCGGVQSSIQSAALLRTLRPENGE